MNFNFVGYFIFAFVTSITPGPNNLLLFSYGKAYGFTDSSKVAYGIMVGFLTELILAGYGVATIMATNIYASLGLKIVGSLWMLYLAFLLRKMHTELKSKQQAKVGFTQMLILQFVNPKAWVMAVTGASVFLPQLGSIHLNVLVYALFFGVVGFPSIFIWLKAGDIIAKLIQSPRSNLILGNIMFILMVASVVTIWI